MMRSLSSAVGGLRSHQTKMDVIGNNIANVNTYGFKASRTTFSDVYYQTVSGSSRPTNMTGGTNPTQIGYGASVATIDVLNTQSGMSSTDRALDIYVNGDGMIAVQDPSGTILFTRLGVLGFDAAGNLVDSSGNFVMGIEEMNPDGTVNTLGRIKVDPEILDRMTGISIGTTGEITGILPGDPTFNQDNSLPLWIQSIEIAEDSNIVGAVTVKVAEVPSQIVPETLGWITEVLPRDNAGIEGEYTFSYDHLTRTISAVGSAGKLTGTYTRGGTVDLKDLSGKTVMSVKTHNIDVPTTSETMGGIDFGTKQWEITVSGTNKGGISQSQTQIFTGVFDQIPFDELGINLNLNISEGTVKNVMNVTLDVDSDIIGGTNTNLSWLKSVLVGSDASNSNKYESGALDIISGVETNVTIAPVSMPGAMKIFGAPNGENMEAFQDMIRQMADAAGYYDTVKYQVEIDNAAGTAEVVFYKKDGITELNRTDSFVINDTTQNIDITFGTLVVGSFPATTTEKPFNVDSDPIANPTSTTPSNPGTFSGVTVKQQNYVEIMSGDDSIGKYQFNVNAIPSSPIKIGDFYLEIDPSALALQISNIPNYFPADPTLRASDPLGNLTAELASQWQYDGKGGDVEQGDGERLTIGSIAIATFRNMAAMDQAGQSYFIKSANSGDPSFVRPGVAGSGTITAGYLEMSNVEVSKEFTDMITTQRGFQANSRIITVSDEMLQELVNMKR